MSMVSGAVYIYIYNIIISQLRMLRPIGLCQVYIGCS